MLLLLMFFGLTSCYNEDDFKPTKLVDILNLYIENNNSLADNKSKITVIADFPSNFNTENDNKVDFIIYKDKVNIISSDIQLVNVDGVDRKRAKIQISNNVQGIIKVEARISIGNALISKEVEISFNKAYLETINVLASALKISPDSSFNEILLTTTLKRSFGVVSVGNIAETRVVDPAGIARGIFPDYRNTTDTLGQIINRFTMGNDIYKGKLYVISKSTTENNEIKSDTLAIYSQN